VNKTKVKTMAECSLMLAIATLLSIVVVYQLPFGGSITLCSMAPLLYVAFHYPLKWSVLTSLAFGLLQVLIAFFPPPAQNLLSFTGVILLDYLLAYGALGIAGLLSRPFGGVKGMLVGGSLSIVGRFLCHFISGIIIWGVYAPEGQSAAQYSLIYNGSFMIGEGILSMAALIAFAKIPLKGKVSL